MSKSKLKLEQATNSALWDFFVTKSPQGTMFSEKIFLEASGAPHHLYLVKQGEEIKAGVALVVSSDGKKSELNDLVIYGGIFFILDYKRQRVKRRHDEFMITEFVAHELAEKYEQLEFQLAPHSFDMRPFLWFRYGETKKTKYFLKLRYTSLLSIESLKKFCGKEEESPCYLNMETVRRYSVREGRKKSGTVVEEKNPKTLLSYYRYLMSSQGKEPSSCILNGMERIIETMIKEKRGVLFHALNKNGTILYCVFYAWDNKRAYYLFGAGNPEIQEPWQGSLIHWHAFMELAQKYEINQVDLEGVNSPKRGWFKLGFGGELTPYYGILLTK